MCAEKNRHEAMVSIFGEQEIYSADPENDPLEIQ